MAVCKFCDLEDLEWVYDPQLKKYRLYTANGTWHLCTPTPKQITEYKKEREQNGGKLEQSTDRFKGYRKRH